jgi:hypothetical protein
VSDALIGVIFLFVIAGGGIIVLDALILRRLRRGARQGPHEPPRKP